MPIDALRTPDDRFAQLVAWPYEPRYAEGLPGFEGLRAHYIDEGPRDSPQTFLCLHGEPSWAYLFRRMIPVFLESGARVVAPDFFGFGRSDKPTSQAVYTFAFHRDYLLRLTERLNLQRVTLVVQDWGGLLGLTLPVDPSFRARLSRLLIMNTALMVGEPLSDGYIQWRDYVRATPDLPVGKVIQGITRHLTADEISAYDAPFPDMRFKAGARAFPELVMVRPDMEGVEVSLQAKEFWSKQWIGQSFMAWGLADPALGSMMEKTRSIIRGCPAPMLLQGGGHFLQEWGEPIARQALKAFGDV